MVQSDKHKEKQRSLFLISLFAVFAIGQVAALHIWRLPVDDPQLDHKEMTPKSPIALEYASLSTQDLKHAKILVFGNLSGQFAEAGCSQFSGGLSRIVRYCKDSLKNSGANEVITMLAGNYFHPEYAIATETSNPILEAIRYLKPDVIHFTKRDVYYAGADANSRLDKSVLLSSNLEVQPKNAFGSPFWLKSIKAKGKNNTIFKIQLVAFGLAPVGKIPGVWSQEVITHGIEASLEAVMSQLKDIANFVVVLSGLNLEDTQKIFERVHPKIDLLIVSGNHNPQSKIITSSYVPIIVLGEFGESLADIDLWFDTSGVKFFTPLLIPIDASLPKDPILESSISSLASNVAPNDKKRKERR